MHASMGAPLAPRRMLSLLHTGVQLPFNCSPIAGACFGASSKAAHRCQCRLTDREFIAAIARAMLHPCHPSAQLQRIRRLLRRRRRLNLPTHSPASSSTRQRPAPLSPRHSPANGSASGTYRCPLPVVRKVCAHAAIFIPAPARTCCRQPTYACVVTGSASQPVRGDAVGGA